MLSMASSGLRGQLSDPLSLAGCLGHVHSRIRTRPVILPWRPSLSRGPAMPRLSQERARSTAARSPTLTATWRLAWGCALCHRHPTGTPWRQGASIGPHLFGMQRFPGVSRSDASFGPCEWKCIAAAPCQNVGSSIRLLSMRSSLWFRIRVRKLRSSGSSTTRAAWNIGFAKSRRCSSGTGDALSANTHTSIIPARLTFVSGHLLVIRIAC